jgi:Zn-dependent metalloprotease
MISTGGKNLSYFSNIRTNHKCYCTFVPPFVLENLARAGVENATLTLHQDRVNRMERASAVPDVATLVAPAAPMMEAGMGIVARRHIYDSQKKWEFKVKLERDEGGPVSSDDAVNNAYDCIDSLVNYAMSKLNRQSLDNKGMDIICNVHYGEKYNNAFWDGNQINLGDGDGNIFVDFSKSLDVIAHELGHGIVQYTANFEYHDQSGALNEHYADVFGSVVTQYAEKQTADTADWIIGDEIMGPELYGEALRSMAAPGTAYDNSLIKKDPQPDHMKDIYVGPNDNGGVHINSGIMNKAFYLAARELETENAALIWYTALQNLWPTANFNDAVYQIVKATQLLIKAKKIKSGSTQKIRAAFKEVGLPALPQSTTSSTTTSSTSTVQLRQI